VNGDRDVRVEEAVHPDGGRECVGLGKVFMLSKRQEWAVEVAVRHKDDGVLAWVRAQGEDASNCSFSGSDCAIMAGAEATFNALAIREGEEGGYKVVRMRDGEDVDGCVVNWGLVC